MPAESNPVKDFIVPLSHFVTNTLILLLVVSGFVWGREAKNKKPAALLKRAAHTLDRISQRSKDAVPDAVLNRTKCVIVIPHVSDAAPAAVGVLTCRESPDPWGKPAFVSFRRDGRTNPGDLLIFLLEDAAVRLLRAGRLRTGAQKQVRPPLVSTAPVPSQIDLAADVLEYTYAADVLSGSRVRGSIQFADNRNTTVAPRIRDQVPENITAQYQSSLVSFFNVIMPTGIIVHHTALIPGENTLPRNEDIDNYHQSRGFEITCFGHLYHVGYHYLILPNGTIQPGRPERCEGAHAQGYNSYLGISVVGDFSSADNPRGEKGPTKPSPEQMASLIQLCRRLQQRYRIPLQHIVRHSDISSTRCPGDRFPFIHFLEQLQASQSGNPVAANR